MHGSSYKPVYLSEAIFYPKPTIGILNFIEAPMGSGKNTWASQNTGDIKLMLVCTNALLEEAKLDGWQEIRQDQFYYQWEKWAFGDNIPTNTKYVTTIQHFSRWLPDLTNCRRLQVCYVDECDLVLLHMRRWRGNNAELGDKFIAWLGEARNKMLCVCMSATGVVSTMEFMGQRISSQLCISTQPLKQYSREYRVFMNGVLRIAQLVNSGEKVLVYCQHPRTVQALKNKLAILGIDEVRCIVSKSTKTYCMDLLDDNALLSIVENQSFPDCDVLIINNAANRGLNIKDGSCKHVVIIDGEADEGIQAHGRLRTDDVVVWRIASSEWVENNIDKARIILQAEIAPNLILRGQDWKDILGVHSYTMKQLEDRLLHFNLILVKKGRRYSVERKFSEPKPPQVQRENKTTTDMFSYVKNTWYRLEELYNIFQVNNIAQLNEIILKENNILKQGDPRIEGKRVRRYKII